MSTAMDTTYLGMPAVPPPALAPRRQSRQLDMGGVPVGGGAPMPVQSMTTTPTADVDATLQQIAERTAAGCQIGQIFVQGEVVETVPESRIVETLVSHVIRLAERMPGDVPGALCVAAVTTGAQP